MSGIGIKMLVLDVYHASHEQVAEFTSWLHVGTREAAVQRLARCGYHHGYLYKFRMQVEDSVVEDVADWRASGANNLLETLAHTDSPRIRKDFFEGARTLIISIRNNRSIKKYLALHDEDNERKFLERELQQFIIGQLSAVHIDVLRYRNDVEDRGSDSYCILCDPRQVLAGDGCEDL